eukprot:11161174-Heterocapsa_arctica.AAC.1
MLSSQSDWGDTQRCARLPLMTSSGCAKKVPLGYRRHSNGHQAEKRAAAAAFKAYCIQSVLQRPAGPGVTHVGVPW